MLKDFKTAALGMIPQQMKLEVIANNMANVNTSGYKKESVFERNLIDAAQSLNNNPNQAEIDDAPIGKYTDFSGGGVHETSNPLDIAIEDKGFFELQDESGNIYLTRAGHFQMSMDGHLIAMDGKYLMGEDGPIALQSEFETDPTVMKDSKAVDIKVSENGEVFANDYLLGSVKITDVPNLQSLRRVSNQEFVPTENTQMIVLASTDIKLRQGWLESSNVDIVNEMIAMIELQRIFEAGSKVIQTADKTLDNTIASGRYY